MARIVGDPPAAPSLPTALTELEILKRKFVRQNRDLVKNNAAQSVRIRALESQVSQLLADNLQLRERNLQLQNESRRSQQQSTEEAIDAMKELFQQRLAGLSELVDGLDVLKSSLCEPIEVAPGMSIQGQIRERIPLSEMMRQCQMPTIVEDKSYPRQTLDMQAVQNLRLSDHSSAGSPDLGPPPVSRLDYEETTVTTLRTSPYASTGENDNNFKIEGPTDDLIANIDTRRKTKPRAESRTSSVFGLSPSRGLEDGNVMLRTGAKRKLADREPEKELASTLCFESADKLQTSSSHDDELPVPVRKARTEIPKIKPSASPKRRVLGEKNVNLSPRKKASINAGKQAKGDMEKKVVDKPTNGRATVRSRRISSLPVASPTHIVREAMPDPPVAVPIILTDLRPKTPRLDEVLSPTISEPSSEAAKLRDTPPPGSLATMNLFGAPSDAGRPSRRARSAVNYAEPSLVAKMRRPGKELADAVTGLQDHRRAMSAPSSKNDSRQSNGDVPAGGDATAKTTLDVAAGSPLHGKSSVSFIHGAPPSEKEPEQTSVATVTRPIADDFDIYEFKDSSPVRGDHAAVAAKPSRSQRRHTTVHRDAVETNEETSESVRPLANLSATRIDRATSRRKSMMV